MKINRNAHVTVSYELRLNGADGEMVEKTEANAPLEFVFGAGKMLEMFEQKLEGLAAGDAFNFELKAQDAYGELNPNAVVELPKNIFEVNGNVEEGLLEVGNQIPMQDSHGNRLTGIVLEVEEDVVKMDFNHPLAGEDLHFSGEVLNVREATEDELAACCGSDCGSGCDSGGCGSCGCGH
ncbi:FKBP-type peptidyl-prolyl cis-trans isomerase SlyD [Breznakibacter xylanolyticus]|uniref:Peptidyl-prolyl cis-trans isomerase n=1 Tax=Breznakibacter xylanolyticus TaxID=990 RepID=A0A2W7NU15_9BACT|nr:FKBP-type peptidyl-prolyl cis-trans isomerase [Breznakibacter xylanolyticus]PZX20094.1 FKBP-type peptidyl-prolyl cis-trans isomerase SlyD [Breznakibacter xylanolyticus]